MLNSALGRYLGKFVKLSNAIICVSKAQKNIITARIPSLNRKIHVVYNPLPELSCTDIIEGDDFGYFGGPSPLKGFHVLCRAMTKINTEKLIVHATNFSNPKKDICELASRLRISLHERLVGKSYDRLYKQIRAVIVPSVSLEPWSYVAVEAILRRRLVIASYIGGIPQLVEGCKGAFLFKAGNYCELAEKMEYVKGLSKEVAADLGAQNREVFTNKFSNERTIDDFTNLCRNLTLNEFA
jgi:glycosyltransferase involved in cell wall biosynthesis